MVAQQMHPPDRIGTAINKNTEFLANQPLMHHRLCSRYAACIIGELNEY